MHRFYVAQRITGNEVSISDTEQLHHLRDVLRLKVNDEVILFDDEGNEYTGMITSVDKKQAKLTVTGKKRAESKKMKLAVACAIPKQAKMEEIIDSLTQLGVDSIIPMETARVIVKLNESKKESRLSRWRKIAQSAARQSQRNDIPRLESITSMESVIRDSQDYALKLILTLAGERKFLKEVLAETQPKSILVLIGPEGDFTPQEIDLAKSASFIPVSLGDCVLRIATAAIAVASYIKFSLNK